MKGRAECRLSDGFKVWEKIYALSSFGSIVTLGAVGISLVDWRWALAYLFIALYGIFGVVMRRLVCPRCPHLHMYNDCLQFPPGVVKRLVKERKETPFSSLERGLFYAYFTFLPLFPIYWLAASPILLIAFLVARTRSIMSSSRNCWVARRFTIRAGRRNRRCGMADEMRSWLNMVRPRSSLFTRWSGIMCAWRPCPLPRNMRTRK